MELEQEYKEFCEDRVKIYIETEIDRNDYEERLGEKFREIKSSWPRLPETGIREIAERALRADLYAAACIPDFEQFCNQYPQRDLFEPGGTEQPI
jgi:hypothetical protein